LKLNFKQGIIRYQTDINDNPTFLQQTGSGISLIVSPDPTLLTFSHKDSDYLFEENKTINNAWPGPFPLIDQWLYWDIDLVSGERTFGITKIKPVISINRPGKVNDRHWFNPQTKEMRVFTGRRYITKLRVFAALLDEGGVLVPYNTGSQVNLEISNYSGAILFDDDNKPVKKFNRFGDGAFITTETPLASQFSRLINFKLENALHDGKAAEFIPKYYCVTFKSANTITLAKHTIPKYPCIGISSEDMHIGEARNFIKNGYVKNELWNWGEDPGTKLFVGPTGEISTIVPQSFSIQNIGHIVSPNTIYVDIKQIINLV
jgi:hypothetical protein